MPSSARAASFRPRFSVGLVYLSAFFLLYGLLLVTPALVETFRGLDPAGQADLDLAAEVARRAIQPRLPLAALASLITVALGSYARILPGMRA